MGHGFHGYVSHNQRVMVEPCCHQVELFPKPKPRAASFWDLPQGGQGGHHHRDHWGLKAMSEAMSETMKKWVG